MKFRNTDSSFGDTTTIYEVESVTEIIDSMRPWLRNMADEHADNVKACGDTVSDTFADEVYEQLLIDFEQSLEEVV